MSIRGGLPRAVERAVAVEATALQVFVKSARQWAAAPLAAAEVEAFRSQLDEHGLGRHTLAHGTYLMNLAAPAGEVRERSLHVLGVELERCARFGIPYLVVHPGSHLGAGEEAGCERVAGALDQVLDAGEAPMILLEVTAGQGTCLGWRFAHLGWILEHARASARLGVCFDTCHALAAGYELRDSRAFEATFAEFDRSIGLERLRAFHLNDSRGKLGSRTDRHAHIGEGRLGLDPFRRLLNDRRFRELPMVLETPKGEDLAEDRRNLQVLRALVERGADGARR